MPHAYLLRYFPEITMTFDQKELLTRLHGVTKSLGDSPLNYDSSVTVVMNTDFEKWNSNMREEETKEIFKDIDCLFGLKDVFSRSHEMFTQSTIYLANGNYVPKFDDDNNMLESACNWSGHLGGIEGLRQKGWTIFTVVILSHFSSLEQIPCQLLGQGDNQVLLLSYRHLPNKTIQQQHDEFTSNLSNFLARIGPPLKLEETWSSSKFFTYGKFPILNGIPLSMSLKRLCRMFRLNNDLFINLDASVSSTYRSQRLGSYLPQ